jgi:uncharacterized membrane protein
MESWTRDVASGLVVLVPLLVTLYAVFWLFSVIASLPLVGVIEPPLLRVAVTITLFFLAIVLVGAGTRTAGGALASAELDGVMNRIPIVRVIYNASKLAVETAVTENAQPKEPVRVETWNGLRMTAFSTGKTTEDGRLICFLPTAPNITSGYVIEVDPADVHPTGEGVETALTRVISAGFGEQNDRSIDIPVTDDDPERRRNGEPHPAQATED